MWDFLIVLGQIPGTNIQITFNELLYSCVIAFISYLIFRQRTSLSHVAYMSSKSIKKEVKLTKRSMKKRRKASTKLLKAYKRKARARVTVKKLRGISAGKLHARQRAA